MKKIVYAILGSTVIATASVLVYRNYDLLYINFIDFVTAYSPTSAGLDATKVFQATKGQPLSDTLNQLSQSAGVSFKLYTDISNHSVTQSFATHDIDTAIKTLLTGYNYSIIAENRNKTVIISGYNGNAPDTLATVAQEQITFAPVLGAMPSKYKNYPAGSVMPVNIPIDQIMTLKEGESANFDLPIGKYAATHDATTADDMGNKTWVGHLAKEGEGYRMVLSQGAAGIMGHVTTPEGTYNVESDGGSTFLIDTQNFKSAGYEGDSILPTTEMMNDIVKNLGPKFAQFQTSLESSKKAYEDAQTILEATIKESNKADTDFNNAYNAIVAVVKERTATVNSYNSAVNIYNQNKSDTNRNTLDAVASKLNAINSSYQIVYKAYTTALTDKNSTAATYAAKRLVVAKAKSAYDEALQALTNAHDSSTPDTSNPTTPSASNTAVTNTVVDLMVLYTTATSSADYAKQRLQYLMTISNQAYKDSGINLSLRLIYTEPTTYDESISNAQALNDLASEKGVFAGIKAKRAQYGADLVFLFRPLHAKSHASCGTTYVGFANGTPANTAIGFGTISDGIAKDSATGSYCEINTATHEIGHSFGLVHDREFSNIAGAYSYSYAWGIQGKFGTIMSYKTPVLMLFSTPTLKSQCAASVCGFDESNTTQSSDQVKSVNLTAPKVASFMPTMLATPIIK